MPAHEHHSMSGDQFRDTCARLFADPERAERGDLGQSSAARFFGRTPRTVRAWVDQGPPAEVALFLNYLDAAKLKPADVLAAIARKSKPLRKR